MPEEANFLEISNLKKEELDKLSSEQKNITQQIGGGALEGLVKVKSPEQHYLVEQAEEIKALVAGHDEDIDSIMYAISGQAFRDSSEPFSIFITGPEGSGKTETAQAMADVLSDGECMKIDCSKFNGSIDSSVAIVSEFVDAEGKLSSPTNEDGSPAIIVFENIEQADENFHEYLASGPMSEGRFTLTVPQQGIYSLDVENAIFVFTSRLGSGANEPSIGYRVVDSEAGKGRKLKQDIKKSADNDMKIFSEKFLDNIGHRVYYESLSDAHLGDVLDNYVKNYEGYTNYGIDVTLSDEVRNEVVESVGVDKRNATTVIRKYQRMIEEELSRMASSGDIPRNHEVHVVKEESGEYGYYSKIDTSKLMDELDAVRGQFQPLLEREEELIQVLEDQGIGFDSDGHPILDN